MSLRIGIDLDDREIRRAFALAPGAMRKHLRAGLGRAGLEVANEARRRAPKAESTLTNSIRHRLRAALTVEIAPHVQYAEYVEKGTGPGGWAPLPAIKRWIRRRGIASNASESDDALARRIRWAIFKRGTRPQPYLLPAAQAKEPRVFALLHRAVARGVDEAFG